MDGEAVLGKIYLDDADGKLTEAYWNFLLLKGGQRDAKAFAKALRNVPTGPEMPAARQFMERAAKLVAETEAIRDAEREMNERLYELYELSPDERLLVETDCAARGLV